MSTFDPHAALLGRQRRELMTQVSHDLRTPLASIQGYLELLLLRHASLDAAERQGYLETAAHQSERLGRLVDDLFQLAELEGDAHAPSAEDFMLAELVQDVVQKFAPEAQRRGIALACDAAGETLAIGVHADLRLVDRLLSALVDNAVRHTPHGGRVTIELAADGARARAAVVDTGHGMDERDLAGLFDRYQQNRRVAENGQMPRGGLGLAIAQRIARLHGGELAVTSRPGQGTRVGFTLPRAGMPGDETAQPVPATTPSGRPGEALDGGTDAAMPDRASAATADRLTALERLCREQRGALERSEAARLDAQADLRAIEQRYLLALRGSQDGLWEWNLASGRVHLSPRWKSMLGFDADEIADGRDAWFARIHPNDRARYEAALRGQVEPARPDAPPLDHELRLLHRDGSVRHVLSRAALIRDDHGVPYRLVGLDTDVTRIRRMQTVLDVLAEDTASAHGEAFLGALVSSFGRALDVDLAFIAECVDDPPTRVRTVAVWRRTQGEADNFEFALDGTPCEAVIQDGRSCFYREDVSRLFPREREYTAYLGMPIRASDGSVLGHLAFFDRTPRGDEMLVDSVYRIFLARAGAEMERTRAGRGLR